MRSIFTLHIFMRFIFTLHKLSDAIGFISNGQSVPTAMCTSRFPLCSSGDGTCYQNIDQYLLRAQVCNLSVMHAAVHVLLARYQKWDCPCSACKSIISICIVRPTSTWHTAPMSTDLTQGICGTSSSLNSTTRCIPINDSWLFRSAFVVRWHQEGLRTC